MTAQVFTVICHRNRSEGKLTYQEGAGSVLNWYSVHTHEDQYPCEQWVHRVRLVIQ